MELAKSCVSEATEWGHLSQLSVILSVVDAIFIICTLASQLVVNLVAPGVHRNTVLIRPTLHELWKTESPRWPKIFLLIYGDF